MARPKKDGIEYFPLDIDVFADRKVSLIGTVHGSAGIVVWLHLLCKIYRTCGYFMPWNEEEAMLIAKDMPEKTDYRQVMAVVQECFRRDLFDMDIFNKYELLTSHGIQKQYIRAVYHRESIVMIKELILLNPNDDRDIPKHILPKIHVCGINSVRNNFKSNNPICAHISQETTAPLRGFLTEETQVNSGNNPQSKVYIAKKEEQPVKTFIETGFGTVEIDPEWVRIEAEYPSNFGPFPLPETPYYDKLHLYYEQMGADVVIEGIKEVKGKAPEHPVSYLKKVLDDWGARGIKTLAQAQEARTTHSMLSNTGPKENSSRKPGGYENYEQWG